MSESPRIHLRAEPLPFDAYVAFNRLSTGPAARTGASRRRLVGLLFGAAVGAVVGTGIGASGAGMEVSLYADHPPADVTVKGLSAAALLAAAALLGAAGAYLHVALLRRAVLRRLHAATPHLHHAHDLVLSEAGVTWSGPDGRSEYPWAVIGGPQHAAGTNLLIVSRTNAIWFGDDAAGPDRDAILSTIRQRVAAAGEGKRPG